MTAQFTRSSGDPFITARALSGADDDEQREIDRAMVGLPPFFSDVAKARIEQVTRFGHTAAIDDASPADAQVAMAATYLRDARDLMFGDSPTRRATARLKLTKAAALIAAATARLDRADARDTGHTQPEEMKL